MSKGQLKKKKRIVTCPAAKEGALFLRSVFGKSFKNKKDKFSAFVAFLDHVIKRSTP